MLPALGSLAPLADELLLVAVFISVTGMSLVIAHVWSASARLQRRVDGAEPPRPNATAVDAPAVLGSDPVSAYYRAHRRWEGHDVRQRLVKAGFIGERAYPIFTIVRVGLCLGAFLAAYGALALFAPGLPAGKMLVPAFIAAGLGYMAPTFVLDKLVARQQAQYRRLFPDVLDMLVVCVEAGLPLEAAINRISREYLESHRMFGIHLSIVMLEARAGKPLRAAIADFAVRTEVEEARAMVALLRQSEELGSSIGRALRVFAAEMRQRRILAAEEKANALPAKMLLPIAVFLFPVTLAIVLAPVLISLMGVFNNH